MWSTLLEGRRQNSCPTASRGPKKVLGGHIANDTLGKHYENCGHSPAQKETNFFSWGQALCPTLPLAQAVVISHENSTQEVNV